VRALQVENDQLRTALRTRLAIEQAKGILAERYALTPDEAFALLRSAARAHRKKIHLLASEVIAARTTPVEIARTIAEDAQR